jgi:ABC-type protease/lipase transport system fused ATPase/permease subunit
MYAFVLDIAFKLNFLIVSMLVSVFTGFIVAAAAVVLELLFTIKNR